MPRKAQFTMSKDGIPRITVRGEYRLTPDEVRSLHEAMKTRHNKTRQSLLNEILADGIFRIINTHEQYQKEDGQRED